MSRWRAATEIQSLLFDADLFTVKAAKRWAKEHDFRRGSVDVKPNTIRLRQADPALYRKNTFRTITLRSGIQAVIAVPK